MIKLFVNGLLVVMLGVASVIVWSNPSNGTTSTTAPSDGALLFRAKGCSGCHAGPGMEAGAEIGPPLGNISVAASTRRPGMSAEEYLRESIAAPQAFLVTGFEANFAQMPALPLTAAEVDAIVDYLLAGS